MTHSEIRRKFLEFFEERGHKIVSSSSLIPDDPSVLFTTAGMQQFKKYYLNEDSPYGNRVASIQKCVRTVDIDEVGDESHLTFFEMLGNFSFKFPEGENSYFKKEAIKLAYDFILGELKIPFGRIRISVFKGDPDKNVPEDRESLEIWKALGIPEEKIFFGGIDDNFWGPTGSSGPCGPTTEIHIDGIEVWNMVFNEYFCDSARERLLAGSANISPLLRKGVDTGMGLERLILILQDQKSVFETDLFMPVITELRGRNLYDYESNRRPERIIADHLKTSVFLIADGIRPSNTEQGYILRRLLRRSIRHAKGLNLPRDFYERSVKTITDIYKDYYNELERDHKTIIDTITQEYDKFIKSLDNGLKEFERLVLGVLEKDGKKTISGEAAFNLYQSFGFPVEFIQELAEERGFALDMKAFNRLTEKHKEVSRAGEEKKFGKR